jgi:hypothetical protein
VPVRETSRKKRTLSQVGITVHYCMVAKR